jgi:NADP-dependent 3-hydroxy acid dehydrogenase YdfG
LSPGYTSTDVIAISGQTDEMAAMFADMPALKAEDIAHSVMFLLSTGYDVNITELTIRPVGQKC